MKKKVLFTAVLSAFLLVGCDGYSKVSAEKAKEVQTANLQKEVTYTKAISTVVVDKLDIKVNADGLTSEQKKAFVSMTKATVLAAVGVEEVGKKVETEITNFYSFRLPANMFYEEEGTTYYTSGSKIKVVSKEDDNGLDATQTVMINEYGYATSISVKEKGTMDEAGIKISVNSSYKTTIKYIK